MRRFGYIVFVLAFSSLSFAAVLSAEGIGLEKEAAATQVQAIGVQIPVSSPSATDTCSFTFTTGNFDTLLNYCVTANGNVTHLETPQGHEHIAVGDFSEGYGICDFNSNVEYFDYADDGDSGNWGTPSVLSQTTKSVNIARTTSDGIWTLMQTFTKFGGNLPSVQIAMALKNNTANARSVRLLRYVDVDADGVFTNNLDGTHKSAFGYNSFGQSHAFGLVLFNAGKTPFEHGGFVLSTSSGPSPCNPFTFASFTPLTQTDGALVHSYNIDVPGGATKTVVVGYKGM